MLQILQSSEYLENLYLRKYEVNSFTEFKYESWYSNYKQILKNKYKDKDKIKMHLIFRILSLIDNGQ